MSQPVPVDSSHPVIHEKLIELIRSRLDFGIQKYGLPLKPFNGRRSLIDAIEESLDLSAYLLQELEERKIIQEENGRLLAEVIFLRTKVQKLEKQHEQYQRQNNS